MKNNLRRVLALLLVLTMLVGIAPAVFADEVEPTGTEVIVGSTDPPNETTAPPEETGPVETTTPQETEPPETIESPDTGEETEPPPTEAPGTYGATGGPRPHSTGGNRFLGVGGGRCAYILHRLFQRCRSSNAASRYGRDRIQQGQLVCREYGVLVVSRGLRQNVG